MLKKTVKMSRLPLSVFLLLLSSVVVPAVTGRTYHPLAFEGMTGLISEGMAESEVVRPPQGILLHGVKYTLDNDHDEGVEISFRTGAGAWHDIAELPEQDSARLASEGVQWRKILRRDAEGKAPEVKHVLLEYTMEPEAMTRLESGNAALVFSSAGAFAGGFHGGRTVIMPLQAQNFLDLEIDDGEAQAFWLGDALEHHRSSVSRDNVVMNYHAFDGLLNVRVEIRPGAPGLFLWEIEVTNHTAHRILEVQFPRLAGIRAGDNHEDDVLMFPDVEPELLLNPAAAARRENTYPRAAMN